MSASAATSVVAENPFFLVTGLPVHTLVVHFAVSMIPLSAIALIAVVLVPKWRGAFLWATLIGLTIGTGAAFISMESGQALADVIGVPPTHSKWGDILPWVALLLLLVGILWTYLSRHAAKQQHAQPTISLGSGAQMAVGIIAILLSLGAFGLTVVVGHTGAAAVWESRSLDTESAEDGHATSPSPAPSGSAAAPGGYTLADVQKHNTPQDCWSLVNGKAYDLTQWINQHPGGAGVIEGMCGKDGTGAFESRHKGSASANAVLTGLEVVPPGASAQPSASAAASAGAAVAVTLADVQKHNTPQDCWSMVNGKAYDLTQWIQQHPGGPGVIESMCGTDGTAAYESQHSGSTSAGSVLAGLLVTPAGGAAQPASPAASPAASAAAGGAITIADVEKHSTPQDCWSVVAGKVYDLTQWIPQHPGGAAVIEAMCGIDGTDMYNSQHAGSQEIAGILASFEVGTLG